MARSISREAKFCRSATTHREQVVESSSRPDQVRNAARFFSPSARQSVVDADACAGKGGRLGSRPYVRRADRSAGFSLPADGASAANQHLPLLRMPPVRLETVPPETVRMKTVRMACGRILLRRGVCRPNSAVGSSGVGAGVEWNGVETIAELLAVVLMLLAALLALSGELP